MKRTLALLSALLLTGMAAGDGLVSLIDTNGRGSSAYRQTPFVEVIDRTASGKKFEYSVPFIPEQLSRNTAGDMQYEWQHYQDTLHWASSVGLNNSIAPAIGTPHEIRLLNCDLQLPADVSIATVHGLTGTTWLKNTPPAVQVSNPSPSGKIPSGYAGGWKNDHIDLAHVLAPRVNRGDYCQYSSTSFWPDTGTVYVPGVRVCSFGCFQSPNYPNPISINWAVLRQRLQDVCTNASNAEYKTYQANITKSIAKNMPLAMHWDGVASLHGQRSGTTLAPVFAATNAKSVADLTKNADPRFASYLTTLGKSSANGFPFPSGTYKPGAPGITELESVKRWLDPGNLLELEAYGYVPFFQTWQQLDNVTDWRTITYWASAVQCAWFSCWSVPVPIPMPVTAVTAAGCTVAPTNGGPGITNITQYRYRYGWVSVPEGHDIPNVMNSPTLRLDDQD